MSTDMERYANMMAKQFPKQFAFATSDTLNTLARTSRDTFRKRVAPQEFDTKSKYLASVVDDQRNKSRDVDLMESSFGELATKFGKKTTTQLGVHQTGGQVKPRKGRKRLHDATLAGRGGNMRKPLRKAYAAAGVKTVRDLKPSASQKSRGFYPRTQQGKSIGLMVWAMRTNYTGLLRMKSPKKGVYGDFRLMRSGKIKMIRNMESRTRTVAPTQWMDKSYKKVVSNRVDIYSANMDKQINYLKSVNNL